MLRGEELGIGVIKCQNKEGTDEIKRIHYALNDVLFKYHKKYIPPQVAGHIKETIVALCKELKYMEVPEKARAKKEEILNIGRVMVKNLAEYMARYDYNQNEAQGVQATINWEVKRLMDAKKDYEIWNNPIQYLDEIREIKDYYVPLCPREVNTDNLYKFNAEILNMIFQKYGIDVQ